MSHLQRNTVNYILKEEKKIEKERRKEKGKHAEDVNA